jgi:hypothetical protein
MGGVVLGILVWQEGGESVGALIALGRPRWRARRGGCGAASARASRAARPGPVRSQAVPARDLEQMLQQIALGGTMIALPIYLQMVLEYNAMEAACRSRRCR